MTPNRILAGCITIAAVAEVGVGVAALTGLIGVVLAVVVAIGAVLATLVVADLCGKANASPRPALEKALAAKNQTSLDNLDGRGSLR